MTAAGFPPLDGTSCTALVNEAEGIMFAEDDDRRGVGGAPRQPGDPVGGRGVRRTLRCVGDHVCVVAVLGVRLIVRGAQDDSGVGTVLAEGLVAQLIGAIDRDTRTGVREGGGFGVDDDRVAVRTVGARRQVGVLLVPEGAGIGVAARLAPREVTWLGGMLPIPGTFTLVPEVARIELMATGSMATTPSIFWLVAELCMAAISEAFSLKSGETLLSNQLVPAPSC